MPFSDGKRSHFQRELRGVKIKAEGRIGAEKSSTSSGALTAVILWLRWKKATGNHQAPHKTNPGMNIILVKDGYLSLHLFQGIPSTSHALKENGRLILCSEPFPLNRWKDIPNDSVRVW